MKSGSLKQRIVVGVITGLMGSGKTTLLHHLFGMASPDLYTSTGVAEQSLRGLLHHIMHLSSGTGQHLSYKHICKLLAPLIQAGVREADVHILAMCDLGAEAGKPPLPTSNVAIPQVAPKEKVNPSPPITISPLVSPPVSPLVQEPSPSCQEIVPLVTTATDPSATGPLDDLLLEFVHMIDTGGQPELMEVMPSLIHNANLAMVLVDLRYSLNEYPPVNRHEKGVCYERQRHSQYTGRDIILKLASTLHAKKSLDENFRLFIIATHRDCVEDKLDRWVRTLNNELESLLLPTFAEQLILFQAPDKTAFVMNLKNPNDDDKDALALIRKTVGKPGLGNTFDTPISFFVFEQDLLEFAKNDVKRDILSLSECKHVGARLKMSDEMVEAALVLFHRQNTYLYFRHVLPNHIFIKPQVPLDIVNGIVAFSYGASVGEYKGFPAKFVTQIKQGIITEEMLCYDKISPHFQKGVYEVNDAIKLFSNTFTIAPLQAEESEALPKKKEREYLMMCLKPAIPELELNTYIPKSSDTVPLVVKFSRSCVPLGCFGSTISCLLSKYGWKVRRQKGIPKCLASNIASLRDPQLLVNVVLVDYTSHLEIYIDSNMSIHELPPNTCSQLHTTVFGAIEKVFKVMNIDADQIKILPATICSCDEVEEPHYATFETPPNSEKYYLSCSESTTHPNEKQLLWMGDATANSKPTLPQLMRLNIPEKVGVSYRAFGILLLNDDHGNKVDNVRASCSNNHQEDIVTGILQKWLQEEPTQVTWENLIKVLKEIKLNTFADYVQKAHKQQIF